MNFIKQSLKCLSVLSVAFFAISFFANSANAQDRARVVDQAERQQIRPTEQISDPNNAGQKTLTNRIVVTNNPQQKSLVTKTASSRSTNPVNNNLVKRSYYNATARSMMMRSIQAKIGSRYRIGTQGPYTYDCSGFIWKVFQEAVINFDRTSARNFWNSFEPVSGDDRFQFGTLVFFNRLGHVGIVADENGFYHASSSQGITYSRFDGYWAKRIVGFRRIPVNYGNNVNYNNRNDVEIISEDSEY
jgi:cell wall-associated NlpC family hydrolase